jgi:hypothetical protein
MLKHNANLLHCNRFLYLMMYYLVKPAAAPGSKAVSGASTQVQCARVVRKLREL